MNVNDYTRQRFLRTAAKAAAGLVAFVPAAKLISDTSIVHAQSRSSVIRPDYENCDCSNKVFVGQCTDSDNFWCNLGGNLTIENQYHYVDCHNNSIVCRTSREHAGCTSIGNDTWPTCQ